MGSCLLKPPAPGVLHEVKAADFWFIRLISKVNLIRCFFFPFLTFRKETICCQTSGGGLFPSYRGGCKPTFPWLCRGSDEREECLQIPLTFIVNGMFNFLKTNIFEKITVSR